ncbi:unnamed protein product [Vitrella brassicaformis CCMP3155]|uniref:Uncharacterized protein n=1 Tax=Vitrella brassicaformis (strain CCMP3155) TaxID=1169540 RepID=A0A0G4FGV5_VITBC|nr:unnamed protein product [Vitrella brassicaformis CCMP3155]|eukprot:CEM12080.1 unnamed protein product [Vitrella brassicaformis CCMP3155]
MPELTFSNELEVFKRSTPVNFHYRRDNAEFVNDIDINKCLSRELVVKMPDNDKARHFCRPIMRCKRCGRF